MVAICLFASIIVAIFITFQDKDRYGFRAEVKLLEMPETTQKTNLDIELSHREIQLPLISYNATVKDTLGSIPVYDDKGQIIDSFTNPTQFGSPRVFLIVTDNKDPENYDSANTDSEYVKVSLPIKPNGQQGWLKKSDVEIKENKYKALVDLHSDSLIVWQGEKEILNTKAVTGTTYTPTPLGTFYVRDVIPQNNPNGDYGPFIVALSGFSETLESFAGGLPAIAIHGTNKPGTMGQERSNGCIRIPNELITKLAEYIPLGTPVTVVA